MTKVSSERRRIGASSAHYRLLAGAVLAVVALSAGAIPPPAAAEAAVEGDVVTKVNDARRREGLAPLAVDPELITIARRYSCQMAKRGFFAHTAPDGETMGDRMRKAGKRYRSVGENIARIQSRDPAERAVAGWLQSPGHRENMLGAEFTHTGVGACRAGRAVYFTQLFLTQMGGPRRAPQSPRAPGPE